MFFISTRVVLVKIVHMFIQQLTTLFSDAFTAAGYDAAFGTVVRSNRPDLGQFQCNGALPAGKRAGKNPREVAEAVVAQLQGNDMIAELSIAGPGFINITVTDKALAEAVTAYGANDRFGIAPMSNGRKTTVDFGGYNIAKSLHVGHLRSTIIGESIKRVLQFMGDNVEGDTHLGDWGTQIGTVIVGIQYEQPDLPYFDSEFYGTYPTASPVTMDDLQRIYPEWSGKVKEDDDVKKQALEATAKLQSGDPGYRALWQHIFNVSVADLKQTTDFLGAHFELWNGEAHYHDRIAPMIEELQKKGVATKSDGAIIVEMKTEKEMPPLLLVKSDGAYLYSTTDVATIHERVYDLHQDLIVYVVDDRQSLHLAQAFQTARQAGWLEHTQVVHAAFGTVNGKDGKPYKTRSGEAASLRGLIEEVITVARKRMEENKIAQELSPQEQHEVANTVGLAAIKFGDLINDRTSSYIFDMEQFTQFDGKTGPYMLYSAVRMKSILRKCNENGVQAGALVVAGEHDRAVLLKLTELAEVVRTVYQQYTPHVLAHYVFELSQVFNNFYQHCNVLAQEDAQIQASWAALTQSTLQALTLALELLTIEVPERM